jgi:hypothetical protein
LGWAAYLAAAAFVASAVGAIVASARALPPSGRRPGFEDDAYYYLVIAKHVVRGQGFTFDGFHSTNGFHPLWMAIAIAAVRIVGPGSPLASQAVAYAAAAMAPLLLGVAICVRWTENRYAEGDPRAFAFLGVLLALALYRTSITCMTGVESGLLVLFLIFIVESYLYDRWKRLIVLLPLAFLTRLDAPLWLGPLILHAAIRTGTWRRRGALVLPLVAVMTGLATFYALTSGAPLPIHAALTSTFPTPTPRWYLVTDPLAHGPRSLVTVNLCSLLVTSGAGVLIWLRARRAGRGEGATWIGVLLASAIVSLLLLLFFRRWGKPPSAWHFCPTVVFLSLALFPLVLSPLERRGHRLRDLAAIVAAVLGFGVACRNLVRCVTDDSSLIRRTFLALRAATPLPGRLAATDCGYTAFWLDRDIVNLDGLTNDREYQRSLRDGRLDEYLDHAGVAYVYSVAGPPIGGEPMYTVIGANQGALSATGDYTFSYFVYSYLYEKYSNTLTFHRDDEALRLPLNESQLFVFRWPTSRARRDRALDL